LLIEPDRNMCEALKMGFRPIDRSWDVRFAVTAAEALSINSDHSCDLIATFQCASR
jgi:hypothetical protein